MIDLPIQLFAKDILKIQPALMSQLIAFISVAWIIKPIFGLLTDLYPIYGYRRKVYIFICSFVIIISLLLLTFLNVNVWHTAIILFVLNMGFSFVMVLGEAVVVELSQFDLNQTNVQDNAKNLISIFFLFRYSGNLIASILKGFLVESVGVRRVFLLATLTGVMIFAAGIILIENKLPNVHNESRQVNESDDKGVSKEKINFEDPKVHNNITFVTEKNQSLIILYHNKRYILREFWAFLKKRYVFIPTIFIIIYM